MAYFDYNATTPLSSAGKQALLEGLESNWVNPSSPYRDSAQVHNVLEKSRLSLAERFQKSPSELVFTGGATEANNAIIRYIARQIPADSELLISPFEHPSVSEAADASLDGRVRRLKALKDGRIDMENLIQAFNSENIGACSLMAVNNESGVVQPWHEVSQLCREAGILMHCDASQWFGKFEGGDFSDCDFVVGCAHKFCGPKGVGFATLSSNSHGFRSQLGGGQESGRRGGTENVPSILSMVAAMNEAESWLQEMGQQSSYRNEFEDSVKTNIPELVCIGNTATRAPNTSFLVMPRFENVRWVRKLDLRGFQVSTGSACSTGSTHSSPLLEALGFPDDAGRRTIRVSSGPKTLGSDWQALSSAFQEVWEELLSSGNSGNTEVISI
ncbi:aminotransferase class V-fold PLP-dependent enzyme [Opitutia bacterium ISCC 51]|nr:aminotransferase class V-fold PLP-dependent enzyme [Opitutae bacterium ISCC 51]QXD27831.1 aminotransferase class V-fold PLP-dependent enzyme [Opitutae bacterium ISCC 52]